MYIPVVEFLVYHSAIRIVGIDDRTDDRIMNSFQRKMATTCLSRPNAQYCGPLPGSSRVPPSSSTKVRCQRHVSIPQPTKLLKTQHPLTPCSPSSSAGNEGAHGAGNVDAGGSFLCCCCKCLLLLLLLLRLKYGFLHQSNAEHFAHHQPPMTQPFVCPPHSHQPGDSSYRHPALSLRSNLRCPRDTIVVGVATGVGKPSLRSPAGVTAFVCVSPPGLAHVSPDFHFLPVAQPQLNAPHVPPGTYRYVVKIIFAMTYSSDQIFHK